MHLFVSNTYILQSVTLSTLSFIVSSFRSNIISPFGFLGPFPLSVSNFETLLFFGFLWFSFPLLSLYLSVYLSISSIK